MSPQDYRLQTFLHVSVPQLAKLSGISHDSWRSYLYRGAQIGERNLATASKKLRMTPEELLEAIEARRNRITTGKQSRAATEQLFKSA